MIQRSCVDIEAKGFLGAVEILTKARYFLILATVVGLLLGLAGALLTSRVYQASASFVSASKLETGGNPMTSLSSAASSFGLDFGGGGNDLSPLFPWILESRLLGREILETEYVDSQGHQVLLLDVVVPAMADTLLRMEKALAELNQGIVRHRFDKQSGVTTVSVTLEDARLAMAVANAYVKRLDEFNQQARQGQANDQVLFLTRRLDEIEKDFRQAEATLRDFRFANRSVAGSPQLMLEESRLLRTQQLNQELYLSLKTKLEVVRLEANMDLPLIAVIDPAHLPIKAFAPRPARLVVVAGILGLVLGMVLAIVWNQVLLWKLRLGEGGPELAA